MFLVQSYWELLNFVIKLFLLFWNFSFRGSLFLSFSLFLSKGHSFLFLLFSGFLFFNFLLFFLLLLSLFGSLSFSFFFCFFLSSSLSFSSSFLFSLNLLLCFCSQSSLLLSYHLLLCFSIFFLLSLEFLFLKSNFLQVHGLLSFHLLFYLKHLQLGFRLSSWELMLSLQSCKICLCSCLLSSGSLGLLDGLSRQEFLFHSFSLKFLCSFLFLKFLKFLCSLFG